MKSHLLVPQAIAAACFTCLIVPAASAQSYPSKSVRMIVASSAGSNPDTVARILAQGMSQAFGQQVVVDNRAGAGGNIGGEVAARAPADGYTIFLAHTNHSINASLYRKLTYDIVDDFTPVTLVALSAFVASVHPSVPAKSVPDLIRIAKARPGDLNYSSAGTGSGTFFSAELFKGLADVNMVHVAYKGGGPALASVVAGETSVYFTPLATGLPHIRSGRLRALGVTAQQRLRELPDVRPIAETLPGYEMLAWSGVMVPAKTPKDVAGAVHKATQAALSMPAVNKRLEDLGFFVRSGTPAEMGTYVQAQIDKYAKLIRQIGLKQQ